MSGKVHPARQQEDEVAQEDGNIITGDRLAALERENAAFTRQLAEQAAQLAQKDTELAEQAVLTELRATHETLVLKMTADSEATLAQLKAAKTRIAELEAVMAEKIAALEGQMGDSSAANEAALEELRAQLATAEQKAAADLAALAVASAGQAASEAKLDGALADLREAHETSLTELRETYTLEIREINTTHETILETTIRETAQKDAQLAQKDAQLAEQAAQLAEHGRELAALRAVAAFSPPAALAFSCSPEARSLLLRRRSHERSMSPLLVAAATAGADGADGADGAALPPATAGPLQAGLEKEANERAFENSLEPVLRQWVHEAPSAESPLLRDDKAKLASSSDGGLKRREAVVERIQATAAPYTSHEQAARLKQIVDVGNELYFGMYNNILTKQVRNNDGYDDFCAALGAVAPDRSRFPQRTGDLRAIYDTAREALPLFGGALQELKRRAERDGGCVGKVETRAAPMKHKFRVLQKHATRVDGGKPTEFETACDIVRGSVVCENMADLLVLLQLLLQLQAEGVITIVRKKDRFELPTAAGWADAMVNFVCSGSDHVCELQLVHATMLMARKKFGGHNAYAAFREAAELLEYVVGGLLVEGAAAAVAELEAAAAAVGEGGEGAATVKAAWVVADAAAEAVLAPLRQARALVPPGSDAAATADALLERGARAARPTFSDTGGKDGAAHLTDGGKGVGTIEMPGPFCHAATGRLLVESAVSVELTGSQMDDLILQLMPAHKDISKADSMERDVDTWAIDCSDGEITFGGERVTKHGAAKTGDLISIAFDATSVSFVKNGAVWAEISGVVLPTAVKFVVSMGYLNNAVLLV